MAWRGHVRPFTMRPHNGCGVIKKGPKKVGTAVAIRPDLMSLVMSKAEVDKAFADLKRYAVSYVEHQQEIAFRVKLSDQDKEAACELAFRLKENDNWRLRDTSYRSWEECCKNEFGGTIRQEVDRWVQQHQVNRILPTEQRVTKSLQARVLAQVPDDLKEEILREGNKAAPVNKHTGKKQLSARVLAEAAADHGITITGLPEAAKPRNVQVSRALTPAQKEHLLQTELSQILERGRKLQNTVWESAEEEVKCLRGFLNGLVNGVDERLSMLSA